MSEGDLRVAEHVSVQLATALRERLAIVADESSRRDVGQHMERLKQVSERIDTVYGSVYRNRWTHSSRTFSSDAVTIRR